MKCLDKRNKKGKAKIKHITTGFLGNAWLGRGN